MPSSSIQEQLEAAESDVLMLIDSCHSAHPSTLTGTGKCVTEVIAACGFEDNAPGFGPHSFTNTLTNELAVAATERGPFYVTDLYDRILRNLKSWKPEPLKDHLGFIRLDRQGNPIYDVHTRKTPVHGFLTNEILSPRIIMLAPTDTGLYASRLRPRVKVEKAIPRPPHGKPAQPLVLMSINIKGDPLVHNEWIAWLRKAPMAATDIKIEASYKSYSTMLLVSMPISVWSLLPTDPAYVFIGFIYN